MGVKNNVDKLTVAGFGDEWRRFDQQNLSEEAKLKIFNDYFSIFPWNALPEGAIGMDVGCGSGRWASVVAPKVGRLIVVDASPEALDVAKINLADLSNVRFELASVGDLPVTSESLDFAYSLGVLHHVPDTAAAIREVADKLKPGAPFLVYLYYSFDNRGRWFKALWQVSNCLRNFISRLPMGARYWVTQLIAVLAYWPLARTALILDKLGVCPSGWPLVYYRDKPFYVMRTDALDRFGTRLEQRFSREEIRRMLIDAGFKEIRFSDKPPYWCAVGIKS